MTALPLEELAGSALAIACRTGQTVYDCLYIALGIALRAQVVTADLQLLNALRGTPLRGYVTSLEETAG